MHILIFHSLLLKPYILIIYFSYNEIATICKKTYRKHEAITGVDDSRFCPVFPMDLLDYIAHLPPYTSPQASPP